MFDAGMRINDNIDSNLANEVWKWSVTITACSFTHIGKSNELDYVRQNQHMWWQVVQIICHDIKPVNMVNAIYCNDGSGYFVPLRCQRIFNIWSIVTNEVSKLLWLNFLLFAFFTFEQGLIVLILYAYKTSCVTFWGLYFSAHAPISTSSNFKRWVRLPQGILQYSWYKNMRNIYFKEIRR